MLVAVLAAALCECKLPVDRQRSFPNSRPIVAERELEFTEEAAKWLTARSQLGMHRSTLRQKMRRYEID